METLTCIARSLRGDFGPHATFEASRTIFSSFVFVAPLLLLIDAPHGRAAPRGRGAYSMTINGNIGWLVMEIISPITFMTTLLSDPLSNRSVGTLSGFPSPSQARRRWLALGLPRQGLALAFLLHYFNRSVVSTLRNSGRSPMHITIPLCAIVFNLLNGYLLGSWVSGLCTETISSWGALAFAQQVQYSLALLVWVLALAGNIAHDEILYALRRKSAQERSQAGHGQELRSKSHYIVPHGLLFSAPFGGVSSPAYLCEWVEWIAYTYATTIVCSPLDFHPPGTRISLVPTQCFQPPYWLQSLTPPMLFVINEVAVMLPRALRTHWWYRRTFKGELPAKRRAIIHAVL